MRRSFAAASVCGAAAVAKLEGRKLQTNAIAIGEDAVYVSSDRSLCCIPVVQNGRLRKVGEPSSSAVSVETTNVQSRLFGVALNRQQDAIFLVDNSLRKLWRVPTKNFGVESAKCVCEAIPGKNPVGAVCDSKGRVYITESYTGDILTVSPDGDAAEVLTNVKPEGPSRSGGPLGITCDKQDNLIVSAVNMDAAYRNPIGKVLRIIRQQSLDGHTSCECTVVWSANGVMPTGVAITKTGLTVITDNAFRQRLIFIDTDTGKQLCTTPCESKSDAKISVADVALEYKRGQLIAHVAAGSSILSINVVDVLKKEVQTIATNKKRLKLQLREVVGSREELQKNLGALRADEALLKRHLAI